MKLQQLRYALEVYRHNLNVSAAAESLYTSQPGISKQIRLLEEELGVQIFIRSGKRVISISEPGKVVLELADKILKNIQSIKNIGNEFTERNSGVLTIATTHTQARYALPKVVEQFIKSYPKVELSIKQGNPELLAKMVNNGDADFAIITEMTDNYPELKKIPCSQWQYAVVVPKNHPLLDYKRPINIHDLAMFPLITYEFAFNNGSGISKAFKKAGIDQVKLALSATDTDILKTYVRLGLGVGIMAKVAFDSKYDSDLELINVDCLFEPSFIYIALRAGNYLRSYTYDFIKLFSSELTHERIDSILYAPIEEDFSI